MPRWEGVWIRPLRFEIHWTRAGTFFFLGGGSPFGVGVKGKLAEATHFRGYLRNTNPHFTFCFCFCWFCSFRSLESAETDSTLRGAFHAPHVILAGFRLRVCGGD